MSKMFLSFLLILSFACPLLAQEVDTDWVRRYDGSENKRDCANSIAVDSSGNVYVTGASNYNIATIRYYPNGDTAWVRRYLGPSSGATSLDTDHYGNVYVTGGVLGASTDIDYLTIKYYPDGETAWVRIYNGPENYYDCASAVASDGFGNVYVTGVSGGDYPNEGSFGDYVTVKYYPNGDTAWVRRYSGPGNGDDNPAAIAVDDSGNVYMTGYCDSYAFDGWEYTNYATIKYYPNGDTAWVRIYNSPEDREDVATDLILDDFGNVYVTGYSYTDISNACYTTIKYYPSGDTAWVRRYEGDGFLDYAYAIAVDNWGNVFVTGNRGTVKYDSAGSQLWVRPFSGVDITTDKAGNIYVAGSIQQNIGFPYNYDYVTIKYFPNGDTAWVTSYNGIGNYDDEISSMALDGSGNVYVTGTSSKNPYPNLSDDYDYATIKYVQFLRGDADGDDSLSLSDIVYLINYLFKKGPAPYPIKSGDCNCDGRVSLSDVVYLIVYLFKSGPPPGC